MSNSIENMHMEKGHENNLVDQGWEKARQNELIKRLDSGENIQEIIESFPEFKEAFKALDTIDCSDGRVLQGRKIGIADSGLLLPEAERAAFVSHFKGKIETITTHSDCGAAALKFNSLKPEEIPEGVKTADEYGTYCGKKMAEDLGAKHEYLDRDEMASEYHNETAIVIDQTGEFDSTNLEGFPAHFVCTGAGLGFSPEYMKSEVKTLAGIALGHHGFGDRFDSANPLRVIVAAKDQEQLNRWIEIGKEAAKDFGTRVKVDGFIAPEKE
ncbi:MAG: hypothetical protein WC719_03185 [Patescibacteria group bacterium]